jgi:integrase
MSRQGVHVAISAAVQDVGGWEALPSMPASALRKFLGAVTVDVGAKALRDRSMLTLGWFLALRRSNLVGLNWSDARDHGDRLEVFLARSKTDQEGVGKTLWIPEVANPNVPCPVAAYRAYREMVVDQVGREPDGHMPLFAPFDRHGAGRWGSRLDGNDVNVLIQDLAVRAGLTPKPKAGEKNPFGAHSLRAGFVTEALRDDKLSISQVQEVTQHKSVDVLMRYRREAQGASSASIAKLTALL